MTTTLSPHAAELINRLRVRGVRLVADGSRLKASPRSLLTDSDRATIRERKVELLALLTAPITVAVISTTEPKNETADPLPTWPDWLWDTINGLFPVDAAGRTIQPQTSDRWTRFDRQWTPWSGDDAVLVAWFQSHQEQLPSEPFGLKRGVTVCEPSKFYAALFADIRAGSNGPRAVGLTDNLVWLTKLTTESKNGGLGIPALQRTDVRK